MNSAGDEQIVESELLQQRREQMFPKLSPSQMARMQAHGQRIDMQAGQVLLQAGTRQTQVYVVVSGSIEVRTHDQANELLIFVLTAGDFSGEMSALRRSAGLATLRVRDSGVAIAIDTEQIRLLVQTDAELSELLMRAFILRRVALISSGGGEITLLGSRHSADSLRLREFLTRNNQPFHYTDIDEDPDVGGMFERLHVSAGDIPVVVCRAAKIFRNPSNHDLAECLGMNPQVDDNRVYDLLIIGAGPSGLAAAVYAASEGLLVRIVDTTAAGGQAGTSSRIENYLGFPTGISGGALAGRALSQAQKFGAALSVAAEVVSLDCSHRPYSLTLADGKTLRGRAVLIASGAQYRTLTVDNLSRFLGNGVYYAATHLESQLCKGEEIVIVGGGNSAGQAAVFLSQSCRRVHLLVRAAGLSESMSNYLIRRIDQTSNITLHAHTQITSVEGSDRLQALTWRSSVDGKSERQAIGHVFVMTGATPNTAWLQNCVVLDEDGFVKTGTDLNSQDLAASRWSLARAPHAMETSLPAVFAAGDVRATSVKRIASAVGEGSICVQYVHRALQEQATAA
ncbi:MAG TPA: FAD-dependent oxidoreductase [Steroidobacteraceae bacterium]